MVDFTFDIEIHVGGCFVEEPTIQYVGGFVRLLIEIDLDKLSFFEIWNLCYLVSAPKNTVDIGIYFLKVIYRMV